VEDVPELQLHLAAPVRGVLERGRRHRGVDEEQGRGLAGELDQVQSLATESGALPERRAKLMGPINL